MVAVVFLKRVKSNLEYELKGNLVSIWFLVKKKPEQFTIKIWFAHVKNNYCICVFDIYSVPEFIMSFQFDDFRGHIND